MSELGIKCHRCKDEAILWYFAPKSRNFADFFLCLPHEVFHTVTRRRQPFRSDWLHSLCRHQGPSRVPIEFLSYFSDCLLTTQNLVWLASDWSHIEHIHTYFFLGNLHHWPLLPLLLYPAMVNILSQKKTISFAGCGSAVSLCTSWRNDQRHSDI